MSVARLRTVLKSEPECVKTVNSKGQLVDLNPAGLKMMGATEVDQVRGTHLSMMVDPRDWPLYERNMNAVFQGETLQWQFRCNSPSGNQRWMEQTAGPVYCDDDSGVITEMIAITRDITGKKQDEGRLLTAKENAEKANAAKTNFLANMSHEIRTPMNGILGMASMLTETKLTSEQQQWIEVIQQSGESLLRILNDILDLSKVEAGRIELESLRFRISDQIEELQQLHSPNAVKKGLALKITGCEHMGVERMGDPIRLTQILNNLINNAIKFTTEGNVKGTFICGECMNASDPSVSSSVSDVHIAITDTGIGMTREQTERVFEPFSQADSSITRRYGGTGLGLTIAKTLTELMHGNINLKSKISEGTCFEVSISLPPVTRTQTACCNTENSNESNSAAREAEAHVKILAVEDGEVNRLVLSHILKKLNADVIMVHDGKQALEAFKQHDFDLILMDIHMPVMDGITATAEIRRLENQSGAKETPIAAVTASVTDAEVDHYKNFGFSHCIAKPTEQARIQEVIDAIRS